MSEMGATTIKVFGDHDQRVLDQLERCATEGDAPAAVLCADGHLGYSQPIGGVVAYRDKVSPSGVGYDIGCGNKAVKTNLFAPALGALDFSRIADEINRRISFGMGRVNDEPVDHPVLDHIRDANFAGQRTLYDLAAKQLGTVGAGNHYVDLFADEDHQLWIGVHFGSRGFGHKTASGFLALAEGKGFGEHAVEGEMDSPPILFATDSDLGQAYIDAMTLAGEYAYAGRDLVCDKVLEILGAETVDEVHNHHNFAWQEHHGGEDVWVVRKGATPAYPDQRGFVGGTMGEDSVILEGVESGRSVEALYSTVHGAGRAMSRTKAAGKMRKRWVNNVRGDTRHYASEAEALAHPYATKAKLQRVRVKDGLIDFDAVQAELREKDIVLRGGAADEAPGAYKRLPEVLAHHEGTVRVQHHLRPLVVVMAGADTYDPFKD